MNLSSLSPMQRRFLGVVHATGVVRLEEERWREGRRRRSMAYGALGAVAMLALYLGIVTTAESWDHALSLLRQDLVLVAPIVLGFGLQMGLFTYLRVSIGRHGGARGSGALAGASGGTATLGMVACCMHHVTDVLPLLGASAAAVFLAEYKVPFMAAGLLSNVAAIGLLWQKIRSLGADVEAA